MATEDACYNCGDVIDGVKVIAMGKAWHPEHFVCCECKTIITGDSCCEINGAPICDQDFARLSRPKCAYCNQPVMEKFVSAMDLAWHPEHFTCAICQTPLEGNMFFEKEGRPYCYADFQHHYAPRCNGCAASITGSVVMALEKPWHQNCFKCSKCCSQIHRTGDTFRLVDGEPICNICPPYTKYPA